MCTFVSRFGINPNFRTHTGNSIALGVVHSAKSNKATNKAALITKLLSSIIACSVCATTRDQMLKLMSNWIKRLGQPKLVKHQNHNNTTRNRIDYAFRPTRRKANVIVGFITLTLFDVTCTVCSNIYFPCPHFRFTLAQQSLRLPSYTYWNWWAIFAYCDGNLDTQSEFLITGACRELPFPEIISE